MSVPTVIAPSLPSGYINFEYSRGSRALIGQWTARVLLSSAPTLGQDWNIEGFMERGIVTEATETGTLHGSSQKVYDLTGYDAGFRLMKSPPLAHQLTSDQLGNVITEIATYCGLTSEVTLEQFTDLDFRHCVQGQTAANAILDLAMLGGSIAYITPQGVLRVAPPRATAEVPQYDFRIGDVNSRALDLEGYASAVMVVLHRRGDAPDEIDPLFPDLDPDGRKPWSGTTPDGVLTTISRSGVTSLPGGTLSWSYQMLMPIGALVQYSAVLYLPGAGIQKTYIAEYEYDVKTSVVRIGQQEQRVWKWGMLSMESVENSVYSVTYYDAAKGATSQDTIQQQVTNELHRTYDMALNNILSEWSETKSYDSGAAKLPFTRPYDTRVEKTWDWGGYWGDYRGLLVTTYTYEEMDVGVADTVKNEDGSPLKHVQLDNEWFIRIPGTQVTMPVRREKITQIDEVFDRTTGKVVSRVERSTDDEGRRDMLARGLYSDLYNSTMERKLALAWLRSLPQRATVQVQQMPGSSSINAEVSTLSQAGRRFSETTQLEQDIRRYIETTAREGQCPFFLSNKTCGVYGGLQNPSKKEDTLPDKKDWTGMGVESTDGSSPSYLKDDTDTPASGVSIPCAYYNDETEQMDANFALCPKYQALRHLVGSSGGNSTPTPVVGLAGEGQVYFEKEVYFDEYLSENIARKCAQQMANNILKAKKASRGMVETVELPINTKLAPDGSILSVRHDFESLRTQVTYLPQEIDPPEYMMLLSAGGVALNLYERESIGKARTGIGKVVDLRPDRALVVLGGRPVSCTYSMTVQTGNSVLVFLPPGTTTSGIIQAVMG